MNPGIIKQVRALQLAVQFLTVVPVPARAQPEPSVQGLSLLWYPLVGFALGLLLTLGCAALPLPVALQAMLTVTAWILLTGGLHLDGVADCADAWVGGAGDREKSLRLLKDPLCGSMGVIALIVVIGLKCVALAAAIDAGQLRWLWVVPLLARTSLLGLFLSTRYVRAHGLGAVLAEHFPARAANIVLLATALATVAVLPLGLWVASWLATAVMLLLVRAAALRRLGGFTGDVAGAQVELAEVSLLLVLAWALPA